jgi:glyoxylase I family protein
MLYRDVLGLDIERMQGDGYGHTWLMARTGQRRRDGVIDNVVTALASKGTTIITPVSHAPRGWSADIADPHGHTISMYQSEDQPVR